MDFLLFVFVANYFLGCGDIKMNPGPLDKDDLKPKPGNELQVDAASGTGNLPQTPETVTTELATAQSSPDTCIAPDMAFQILDTIQQQNKQF